MTYKLFNLFYCYLYRPIRVPPPPSQVSSQCKEVQVFQMLWEKIKLIDHVIRFKFVMSKRQKTLDIYLLKKCTEDELSSEPPGEEKNPVKIYQKY